MKREIKFRAWHRLPEGRWNDNDDDWEYQMNYDLAFEEYEPINDLLNDVENLMQYTGLKDKNGKEIYEGDIWLPGFDDLKPFEIRWVGEKFNIADYYIGYGMIIGNKFENPELL